MTRLRSHAARVLRAACVFAVASSCARPDDGPVRAAVVSFYSSTAPGDPRLGEVSVYPLDRSLLAAVESSRPSVEQWQRILAVRVATDDTTGARSDSAILPLLGTYAIAADTLRFRPRSIPLR